MTDANRDAPTSTAADAQPVPVLPLRDVVVYPHMVIPLFVGREKSILALDQAMRTEIYDAVQGAFADCDIIVTPTLACLPVKNATNGETLGPERVNGEEVDRLIGWCLTYPLNFSGNPAASIPAGLSSDGLPVGMQIIGNYFSDAHLLNVAHRYQQATDWHRRSPAL